MEVVATEKNSTVFLWFYQYYNFTGSLLNFNCSLNLYGYDDKHMISMSWLAIGIIAGVMALILDPKKGGLLGAILVGIVGAILGGFTAGLVGGASAKFTYSALPFVIIFAVGLLFISRTLKRV